MYRQAVAGTVLRLCLALPLSGNCSQVNRQPVARYTDSQKPGCNCTDCPQVTVPVSSASSCYTIGEGCKQLTLLLVELIFVQLLVAVIL